MSNSQASKWLNGEVSIGKLLESAGVPRVSGDDLIGQIWHAYNDRLIELQSDLERRKAFAEKSLEEARSLGKEEDAVAESASVLAYVTALADLRMRFGEVMKGQG